MHHRLIMVTGVSPGAGKSSISEALFRQLYGRGISTRWLSEGDLLRLDTFARFDQEIFREDLGAIDTLLAGARALLVGGSASETVWITDALLPGYYWLFGRYPLARVEAFSRDLTLVVRPLHPLIVYLGGDAATVFGRAIAQRGDAWREMMVAAIKRWQLPYYPDTPIQNLNDVVRFFTWLDHHSRALLARWLGETLILDTIGLTVEDVEYSLLDHLKLIETDV